MLLKYLSDISACLNSKQAASHKHQHVFFTIPPGSSTLLFPSKAQHHVTPVPLSREKPGRVWQAAWARAGMLGWRLGPPRGWNPSPGHSSVSPSPGVQPPGLQGQRSARPPPSVTRCCPWRWAGISAHFYLEQVLFTHAIPNLTAASSCCIIITFCCK